MGWSLHQFFFQIYFYVVCMYDYFVTENCESFLHVYFMLLKPNNLQHRVNSLVFSIVLYTSHPASIDYFGKSPIYFTGRGFDT